jgi:outer membrane lipoprotein-sorting protein
MKDKDNFIKKFDEISSSTTSIQCDFVQKKHLSFSKEPLKSGGTMYYQDQNLRWEQVSPKEYLMVISDDQIQIKEDGVVREHSLEESKYMIGIKEIMVGSITGTLLNSTEFETSFFEDEANWIIKLVPKLKKMKKLFSEIKMYFHRSTYRMSKVYLIESSGDYTEIEFINQVFNKTLDNALFKI